jgi:hypothetical protein
VKSLIKALKNKVSPESLASLERLFRPTGEARAEATAFQKKMSESLPSTDVKARVKKVQAHASAAKAGKAQHREVRLPFWPPQKKKEAKAEKPAPKAPAPRKK